MGYERVVEIVLLYDQFPALLVAYTIHIFLSPCNASSNGAIFFTEAFVGNGTKFCDAQQNGFLIVSPSIYMNR